MNFQNSGSEKIQNQPKRLGRKILALLALTLGGTEGKTSTPVQMPTQVVQTLDQKNLKNIDEEKISDVLTPSQQKKLQEKLETMNGKNIFTFEDVELILERRGIKRHINPNDKLILKNAALFLKNPRLENGNYIADVVNTAGDSNLHKLEVNLGNAKTLYQNFDKMLENKNGVIGSFIILGVDFYDNKVANISLATNEINKKFQNSGLQPGEKFSYLKYGSIGKLISTKAFPGKALGPNGTHPIVPGGGICALATGYKFAANSSENNQLKVVYSRPHSRDNYLVNPQAPLEVGEWKDATAYNDSIDLVFQNAGDKELFISTDVIIATDPDTPINRNGLESYSTFFVADIKIQKSPVSQQTMQNNKTEFEKFASERKSIFSKLNTLR